MSDCHVFHTGNRAKQLNLTARSQKEGDPTIPPQQKLSIFPLENGAVAPSPSRPSPHLGAHWFIVIFLRLATGWSDQIRPPGRNLMMP